MIYHTSLTAEEEDRVRRIYEIAGQQIYPTYEQWERRFMEVDDLQTELWMWEVIADAYPRAQAEHPELTPLAIIAILTVGVGERFEAEGII